MLVPSRSGTCLSAGEPFCIGGFVLNFMLIKQDFLTIRPGWLNSLGLKDFNISESFEILGHGTYRSGSIPWTLPKIGHINIMGQQLSKIGLMLF